MIMGKIKAVLPSELAAAKGLTEQEVHFTVDVISEVLNVSKTEIGKVCKKYGIRSNCGYLLEDVKAIKRYAKPRRPAFRKGTVEELKTMLGGT